VAETRTQKLLTGVTTTRAIPGTEEARTAFLDRIYKALWDFECAKRVVICHPDDEDRLRSALDSSGVAMVDLRANAQFCQPGEAILLPSVTQVMEGNHG
jgi:hypothetical protein